MKSQSLKTATEQSEEGLLVGRDPRTMTVEELNANGHFDRPLLDVIRAKCLDCCRQNQAEVRRCTAIKCDLWPYRMNKNPLRKRELSDEQKQAMADRMRGLRKNQEG